MYINKSVIPDEFHIKAGLKGRPYHNEILNSGRLLPRERGLKAWKGRGTFEKDTPMIKCVHQRGGKTYFDVHNTKQSLISNIRRLINCHCNTWKHMLYWLMDLQILQQDLYLL